MNAYMDDFLNALAFSVFILPVHLICFDSLFLHADMPDGGAAHFAQTVREIKARYAMSRQLQSRDF